jgi:hypothetical protein
MLSCVVTIDIPSKHIRWSTGGENRRVRWRGGGNNTARRRCAEVDPWDLFPWLRYMGLKEMHTLYADG